MNAASEPSRISRASACQLTTPVKKRRGVPRMAAPWRSCARRRRKSSQPTAATAAATSAEVIGWLTTNETSTSGSSPLAVGTGRNPLTSAHATSAAPNAASHSASGTKVAASVGYREPSIRRWTIANLMTSPPRAGTIELTPAPAR